MGNTSTQGLLSHFLTEINLFEKSNNPQIFTVLHCVVSSSPGIMGNAKEVMTHKQIIKTIQICIVWSIAEDT